MAVSVLLPMFKSLLHCPLPVRKGREARPAGVPPPGSSTMVRVLAALPWTPALHFSGDADRSAGGYPRKSAFGG